MEKDNPLILKMLHFLINQSVGVPLRVFSGGKAYFMHNYINRL